MNERQILVHFGQENENVRVEDFNTMTVAHLLAGVKCRFNLSSTDLGEGNFHFLYDGPYTKEPLTDERLHEIDEMIRKKLDLDRTLEPINAQLEPIELWLCYHRENNIFVSTNVEMENVTRATQNVGPEIETFGRAGYVPPQITTSVNQEESTSVIREEFPFVEKRTALRVTVHRNERTEDIEVEDINNTTLDNIAKIVKEKFFGNDPGDLFAITESLYEGPSSARFITDESYREIVTRAQKRAQGDGKGVNVNVIATIELWLLLNDEVLSNKVNMENARMPLNLNAPVEEIVSDVPSYVPPQTTTVNPAENGLPEDDRHKFIIPFREYQKKQYRSDGSCRANKKKKLNNVTTSSLPSSGRCKAKKNDRKSITHLQAVKSKEGSRRGEYPIVQLPNCYADLLQQGKSVWLCIAVGKKIGNRHYLDALKGFLIDTKNLEKSLWNPVLLKLDPTNIIPPRQYQLKLRLIQVAGDLRRSSRVEFNENFDFTKTVVDEASRFSNCDSANDNDESDDFQIYVVLATGEIPLNAVLATGEIQSHVAENTGETLLNVVLTPGEMSVNVSGAMGEALLNVVLAMDEIPLNFTVATGEISLNVALGTGEIPLNVVLPTGEIPLNVALATSEIPLNVDWSTLIESPIISYVTPKSNKKTKTNQITGTSAVVQDESETTQDEE